MAWWLTVYCRKPVSHLSVDAVRKGLLDEDPSAPAGGDYLTLAEQYEVDEETVKPALKALELKSVSDSLLHLEISYRLPRELRPIVVHVWNTPERLAEELDETADIRNPPKSAQKLLEGVVEIVAIELGFQMLEDMGVVLAFELARWLAQKGDGVIADDDNRWQMIERGAFRPLEHPKR